MFGILKERRVYLDYAATTPLCREARREMARAEALCGNAGSLHAEGLAARALLDEARCALARELSCKAREVLFTSGATESNNMAILGAARALEMQGRALSETHWVTTVIEHPSVLEPFREIERRGASVTYVAPDAAGRIAPSVVAQALRYETVFVSVGWANNEIGVVQPLSEIGRAIRAHTKSLRTRVLFHTDAGQAPLYIAPNVHTLGVDMASFGAHKLYGPGGIGALFVASDVFADALLAPIMFGGGQEREKRPGTEHVAGALGFAAALSLISREREEERVRIKRLRDLLLQGIVERVPDAVVNGPASNNGEHALPHMLNVSIPDTSGEYLALSLDAVGVALSTKSACKSGEEGGSHVVAALVAAAAGGAAEYEDRATSALRFSLGRDTTERDIIRAIDALAECVQRSRRAKQRANL